MMIYTSYFANLKKIPEGIIPISICAKAPSWYSGYEYKKLAPTYQTLKRYKESKNESQYIKSYTKTVLDTLDPYQVVNELIDLIPYGYKGNDIVLLCYEKPTDFCHRHLVAKWLNDNDFECKEWYQ